MNAYLSTFITTIIAAGVGAAVAAVKDHIGRKQKDNRKEEAKEAAFMTGILALLHDRIFAIHAECSCKGYATPEEMRNLDYLYQPYHALGGNGTGTQLYERVMDMPTEPPKAAV